MSKTRKVVSNMFTPQGMLSTEDMLNKRVSDIDREFSISDIMDQGDYTNPIMDLYQSKIRPNLVNNDNSVETLAQTPLKYTPVYPAAKLGRGIIGLGGKVLESVFQNFTGGSPEDYQMRKSIDVARSSNQPLNENQQAFINNLNEEFMTEFGTMAGTVSPVSKVSRELLEESLNKKTIKIWKDTVKDLLDTGGSGKFVGEATDEDITKFMKDKRVSREMAQYLLNQQRIATNYVNSKLFSKEYKDIEKLGDNLGLKLSKENTNRFLRNEVGNRYAGSKKITSLADVKPAPQVLDINNKLLKEITKVEQTPDEFADYLGTNPKTVKNILKDFTDYGNINNMTDKEVDELSKRFITLGDNAIGSYSKEVEFAEPELTAAIGPKAVHERMKEAYGAWDYALKELRKAKTRTDKILALDQLISVEHSTGGKMLTYGYGIADVDRGDRFLQDVMDYLRNKK